MDLTTREAAIARCARAIARVDDPILVVDEALGAAVDAIGAAAAGLVLVDDDGSSLRLDAVAAAPGRPISIDDVPALIEAHDSEAAQAVLERRILRVDDATTGRLAVVPLITERAGTEAAIGVLVAAWEAGPVLSEPIMQRETETLETVASLLAIAIDRSRLSAALGERAEWLERVSHTDALTGLANRRSFDRILELELARARRLASPVGVAIVDIDAMAVLNDAAGRPAGDDLIRSAAAIVADSVRVTDSVARLGADSFGVIAPGSDGTTIARRILQGIGQLPALAGSQISACAGVAAFPTAGEDGSALSEAARIALEKARTEGRGKIVVAGEPT